MFIHEKGFPDEGSHLWVLGDVIECLVGAIFKKIDFREGELFTDANPFQYVRALDTVHYFEQFDWLSKDYFDPINIDFLDGDRLEKFLCWNEDLASQFKKSTKPSPSNVVEDRLDVVIHADMWKYNK